MNERTSEIFSNPSTSTNTFTSSNTFTNKVFSAAKSTELKSFASTSSNLRVGAIKLTTNAAISLLVFLRMLSYSSNLTISITGSTLIAASPVKIKSRAPNLTACLAI